MQILEKRFLLMFLPCEKRFQEEMHLYLPVDKVLKTVSLMDPVGHLFLELILYRMIVPVLLQRHLFHTRGHQLYHQKIYHFPTKQRSMSEKSCHKIAQASKSLTFTSNVSSATAVVVALLGTKPFSSKYSAALFGP